MPEQAPQGTVRIPATPSFNYSASEYDFILSIFSAVNNHDWQALAPYVAYPCNYFGERYMTMEKIRREMISDSHRYGNWRATYYPTSFSRQVSNQYSRYWVGPMIYDEISAYIEVDVFHVL